MSRMRSIIPLRARIVLFGKYSHSASEIQKRALSPGDNAPRKSFMVLIAGKIVRFLHVEQPIHEQLFLGKSQSAAKRARRGLA